MLICKPWALRGLGEVEANLEIKQQEDWLSPVWPHSERHCLLPMPGRWSRCPCGQDLHSGPGDAPLVCLQWRGPSLSSGRRRVAQSYLSFCAALLSEKFFLFFPPSTSALHCIEGSCVMLEFFSQQTKEPSCGAGCIPWCCRLLWLQEVVPWLRRDVGEWASHVGGGQWVFWGNWGRRGLEGSSCTQD